VVFLLLIALAILRRRKSVMRMMMIATISIVDGRYVLNLWREILWNQFSQGHTGSVTNHLKMGNFTRKMTITLFLLRKALPQSLKEYDLAWCHYLECLWIGIKESGQTKHFMEILVLAGEEEGSLFLGANMILGSAQLTLLLKWFTRGRASLLGGVWQMFQMHRVHLGMHMVYFQEYQMVAWINSVPLVCKQLSDQQ
jgi:hypothetical protein